MARTARHACACPAAPSASWKTRVDFRSLSDPKLHTEILDRRVAALAGQPARGGGDGGSSTSSGLTEQMIKTRIGSRRAQSPASWCLCRGTSGAHGRVALDGGGAGASGRRRCSAIARRGSSGDSIRGARSRRKSPARGSKKTKRGIVAHRGSLPADEVGAGAGDTGDVGAADDVRPRGDAEGAGGRAGLERDGGAGLTDSALGARPVGALSGAARDRCCSRAWRIARRCRWGSPATTSRRRSWP